MKKGIFKMVRNWFVHDHVTTLSFHDQDIRMVTAKKVDGVRRIKHVATFPLPQGTIVDGVIYEPSTLVEVLRTMKRQYSLYEVEVVIPTRDYWAFGEMIHVPHGISSDDVSHATVANSLQKKTGLDPRDLDARLTLLTSWHGGAYVHVSAFSRVYAWSYKDVLRKVGIRAKSFQTHIEAMARSTNRAKHASFLIDVGSYRVRMAIADRGRVYMMQDVTGGFGHMYQYLLRTLDTKDEQTVLDILWNHGVGPTHKDPAVKEALRSMVHPAAHWMDEAFRTWHSEKYEGRHQRNPIQGGYVYGDAANLPGLSRYLSQKTRISVAKPDAWDLYGFSGKGIPPMHKQNATYFSIPMITSLESLGVER